MHHAVERDNDADIIDLLLDHGADPMQQEDDQSAVARAARRGRSDLLEAFAKRRLPIEVRGVERLIVACARNDAEGLKFRNWRLAAHNE